MSWLTKLLGKDGSSQAVVKPASTAPVTTDEAIVVALSPNTPVVAASEAGTTAHDAPGGAVNPLAIGGYSSAAAPADVSADADVVRAWLLRNGAQAIAQTFSGALAATAASGVQRVGVVGGAGGASIDAVLGASAPPNGIMVGGRGATTNPTAEVTADLIAFMVDKLGKLVTTPHAPRELRGATQTAIAATTETTIVAAAGASIFRDLHGLIITTAGLAAQTITIRRGTAGTITLVLNYPNAAVAPGQPLALVFEPPIPALAANAAWTAQQSVATPCNYTAIWSDCL